MNKLTIINGNCINEIDKLDDDFDICLTSPPYNLYKNNFECEQWDTINKIQKYKFNKDKIENYSDFITTAVLKTLEKCKYVFLNIQGLSGNKKDIIDIQYNLKNYYCDTIIWNKGGGVPNGCNNKVMTNCFEYIFIYSKNSSRAVGTKEWNGNVTNIINIKGNQNNEYSNVHKALFPENLVEYILTNFVKENGKVLDIFGGLGTTLIVAKKLNMNATMIEISKDYCRLAKERIDNNLNLFDITND